MNEFSPLDDFVQRLMADIASAFRVLTDFINAVSETLPDTYYDNMPVFPPANAPNSYLNGLALHLKNPHKQRDWHAKYMREYYRRQK